MPVDAFVLKIANRAKGRRGADPEAEEEKGGGDLGAIEDDALSELASILDVPEEDTERFGSALRDYVKACMMRGKGEKKRAPAEEAAEEDEE
ncbi:MAG TPA: hypothetical protein VFI42_12955 [Thermomicrobiaceae bacterium]|nr:hypothetical protein [Thermomicrobiaceae bacterium]